MPLPSLSRLNHPSAQVKPAAVITACLVALGVAVGGWFYMREADPALADLKVIVNGKEVDPKEVLKGGTISLAGGGSFTMSKDTINPHALLGETFKGYFSLPEGPQRKKFLDDMIDQQEKAKKDMGISTDGEGVAKFDARKSPTTKPGENRTVVMRSGGAGAMDSMPPEIRAQLAEFTKAMNDRRAERGLPAQQGMMMIRTKTVN